MENEKVIRNIKGIKKMILTLEIGNMLDKELMSELHELRNVLVDVLTLTKHFRKTKK